MRAVLVSVSGRVQGVGFRAWVVGVARKLELDGWVRNRLDGTVEALFKGEEAVVEAMVKACHEGPLAARVESVTVAEAQGITEKSFFQKPTV